jgi:hypothetical protein
MGWITLALAATVVILLFYIRRLKRELECYQQTWNKIEGMTDHNKNGDIVIHAHKVVEIRPESYEAPESEHERIFRHVHEKYGVRYPK